jgi:hypothetical protein
MALLLATLLGCAPPPDPSPIYEVNGYAIRVIQPDEGVTCYLYGGSMSCVRVCETP